MKKIIVDPAIFEMFPGLTIGVIVLRDINNSGTSSQIAEKLWQAQLDLKERFKSFDEVKDLAEISAWYEIHRKFGSNPKRDMPSHAALLKRVLNGKPVRSINPLVDIYNTISLQYLIPAGGEDLDKCVGDINLCFAKGDEQFIALGSDILEHPELGEVIYLDGQGVICRKFNWREGQRTCLSDQTKNALLVFEFASGCAECILEDQGVYLSKLFGGRYKCASLSACNNVVIID